MLLGLIYLISGYVYFNKHVFPKGCEKVETKYILKETLPCKQLSCTCTVT